MLFFHKSFNKRLLRHISELDEFGLLPIDWQWHREKLEQLDTISEEMIDDLIHLHNAHQDLGETIPHLLPLIQELHQDIEAMVKQDVVDKSVQEKEAATVNKLIIHLKDFLGRQGYVRYGKFRGPVQYLTPQEITYYNSLVDESKWKKALRYIKRKWNERVDRTFIQSVHTIHWGNIESIEYALTKMSRKDEISCVGYGQPPYLCLWIGGVGVYLKGYFAI